MSFVQNVYVDFYKPWQQDAIVHAIHLQTYM